MKTLSTLLLVLALAPALQSAEKPRIFITESQAVQVSGDTSVADVKGSLSLMGGTSPQSVEAMKSFTKHCPDVTVTANREKADFIVRLDHEQPSPVTPFVRGNKVAVFDTNDDLIFSDSTRLLGNAVKGACAAITRSAPKR